MLRDEYLRIVVVSIIKPNHNFNNFQHANDLRYLLDRTEFDQYYSEYNPINVKPDANWNCEELYAKPAMRLQCRVLTHLGNKYYQVQAQDTCQTIWRHYATTMSLKDL